MAWQTGVGKHQSRKEASAAQRAAARRAAIKDAADPPAKRKKVAVKKPFGLCFYWMSMISKREVHMTNWYPTKEARATGLERARKKASRGQSLNFTHIDEVER